MPPENVETPLKRRIRAMVDADGPMPVAQFMALCLADPREGYYRARQPFGRSGDFITAPEVSQMFGELIGAWAVSCWREFGRPAPFAFIEIGPGRGTLMADMLRAAARINPDFRAAACVFLTETSPALQAEQRKRLAGEQGLAWIATLDEAPALPLVLIANELFDALPARQIVRTVEGWRERMVGLVDGEPGFIAGGPVSAFDALPPGADRAPPGTVFEPAPAREALAGAIAARILRDGGVALAIDYGHLQPGFGDTLQALRQHKYISPFAHPGEDDLTSHVDFYALAQAARAEGATTGAMTQGDFLLALGLLERAGRLGAGKPRADQDDIRAAVERLAGTGSGQMGDLFKCLAIARPGALPPPFSN